MTSTTIRIARTVRHHRETLGGISGAVEVVAVSAAVAGRRGYFCEIERWVLKDRIAIRDNIVAVNRGSSDDESTLIQERARVLVATFDG